MSLSKPHFWSLCWRHLDDLHDLTRWPAGDLNLCCAVLNVGENGWDLNWLQFEGYTSDSPSIKIFSDAKENRCFESHETIAHGFCIKAPYKFCIWMQPEVWWPVKVSKVKKRSDSPQMCQTNHYFRYLNMTWPETMTRFSTFYHGLLQIWRSLCFYIRLAHSISSS